MESYKEQLLSEIDQLRSMINDIQEDPDTIEQKDVRQAFLAQLSVCKFDVEEFEMAMIFSI